MSLAKPRWKIKESDPCPIEPGDLTIKAIFVMDNGDTFSVIGSSDIVHRIGTLPYDYIDLGNEAADLDHELGQVKDLFDNEFDKNRILRQRIEALGDDAIVPVLAEDLEKALNLAIRWAFALGIQANQDPDSLYGQLQTLAHKYKMNYTPPKDYNYREMLLPLEGKSKIMRELSQDESYIQVTDIIDDPDDPFIYRITTTSGADEIEVLDAPMTEEEYEGSFLVHYDPNLGKMAFTKIDPPLEDIDGNVAPVSHYELEQHNDPASRGWLVEDDDGDPS